MSMGDEARINRVLAYQAKQLGEIEPPDYAEADERISASERLLEELGYELPDRFTLSRQSSYGQTELKAPSWEELCTEAEEAIESDVSLESLFSEDELHENRIAVKRLNEEFDQIHRLDKNDVAIIAVAALLASAADILFVGIPHSTPDGLKAGSLSDFIREAFEKKFPQEEMQRLANSTMSKVPYDAQDNRNTTVHVEGLSSYYHRLYSLGHDPLLGFVIGVADILSGRMTTIDRTGKIVSQVMENYADRRESNLFAALSKQLVHLKSDLMTSMGLPAPLMTLFNLLQFGSIGEEELTISEVVAGMYYKGYDFIHFCSMSVSAMLVEVVVRTLYALKRVKEGVAVKEAIPLSTNREKMPKLATMLFVAHSGACAINAGKVYFVKDPMAINYAQWLAFAKYSYDQLKWGLISKPSLRNKYVIDSIDGELAEVYESIDELFEEVGRGQVLMLPSA